MMDHDPAAIARAMAGLKATIEKRIAERDDPPVPVRARVAFDWAGLARALRPAVRASGLSQKRIAAEMGVTSTAMSKLASGGNVSIESVKAACDWAGLAPWDFYRAPVKSDTCTLRHVKQTSASRAEGAPAGRATRRGPQSRPRPAAGEKGKP